MIHVDDEGAYNAGWITASNQLQLFEADPIVRYPLPVGTVFEPDGLMWYECPGNPHEEYSPLGADDLTLLDDNATYTTAFGQVSGYRFNDQFWAPGIGPIAFNYSEEYTDTQTDIVYTFVRKRELIGYDLVD